ncbi:PREDICTED: probable chitinase 2 isoform X2 [Papilio polytes]|uniref:probable chitinase 2 isoform X2 n=1 Tax=Papilio polytes TaxID=76194 RepID=UPI0006765D5B|nr:PREDICTED: probable chitinase 2 isoform X2 [Papilio polytes]
MGIKNISVLFILATLSWALNCQNVSDSGNSKVVMCFMTTWSIYRSEDAKFKISDIDTSLCTHVVYAFSGYDDNRYTVKSLDPGLDRDGKYENAGYKAMAALKEQNPNLKVLLSIGGWNEGSLKFSNLASSATARKTFIKSVLEFLNTYGFDGIDMHWKFPTQRDGRPDDKDNCVTLMKEIKEAFTPARYILAMSLGAQYYVMEAAYSLPKLNDYVDYFITLAYDYHGVWDGVVNANAPLNSLNKDDVFSVENTLRYLMYQGVSPWKVLLGLPLFGRTFILENADTDVIEFGSTPVKSEGFDGPYTRERGFIGYNEICMELKKNDYNWTRLWHEKTATPYLRNGEKVITYDNARSLAAKVKKAMEFNLGGVMVYSIDTDDFKGLCDREPDYVSLSFKGLHNFVEKFNRIASNPVLQKVLKNLNLPDAQKLSSLSKSTEIAHKNHLWTTESSPNYPLLRAIVDSLTLATEEKIVMTDMVTLINEKPPKQKPGNIGVTTNSLFTVVCYFCFI